MQDDAGQAANYKYCPHCGEELGGGKFRFCPYCGELLSPEAIEARAAAEKSGRTTPADDDAALFSPETKRIMAEFDDKLLQLRIQRENSKSSKNLFRPSPQNTKVFIWVAFSMLAAMIGMIIYIMQMAEQITKMSR